MPEDKTIVGGGGDDDDRKNSSGQDAGGLVDIPVTTQEQHQGYIKPEPLVDIPVNTVSKEELVPAVEGQGGYLIDIPVGDETSSVDHSNIDTHG